MSNTDLFGELIPRSGARTDAERKREQRRLKDRPKGYAAPPGSGPAGEFCRTCKHSYTRNSGGGTYRKCELVKATKGPGSDIVLKSPACSRWEAKGEGA